MTRGVGRGRRRALLLAAIPLAAVAPVPSAAEAGLRLEVGIGGLVHEAFDARNLRARLFWVGAEPRFEVRADRLRLPEPLGLVEGFHLGCPRVEVTARRLACTDARVSAEGEGWRLDGATIDFDWDREAGTVGFAAPWPGLFRARGRIGGRADASGLRVDLDLAGLDLASLTGSGLVPLELPVTVQSGTASIAGHIDTRGPVTQADLNLAVSELEFSDPRGLQAAEGLSGSGRLAHGPSGYALQARFTEGAAFFEPWFLDLAEAGPVSVSVDSLQRASAQADGPAWTADAGSVALGTHTRLRGAGLFYRAERLQQGEIEWRSERLDLAGRWLAEPVLAGTVLGRTRFEGQTRGQLSVAEGRAQAVTARWQELGFSDDLGRFALQGAAGHVAWSAEAEVPESSLSVAAGEVLGLPVGPFRTRLQLEPRGLHLPETLFVPVFDGGVGVDHFLFRVGPEGPEVEFEGGIRALSLERLTETLGWPRFTGKLAGIIPRVFYDVDGLRVDAQLLVQVFDGEIVISGLRVRNLFGIAPELELSADIRRLELDLLTSALDVGRVEGRLSGSVEDLLLFEWVPQRMQLSLATPEEDPGRRRISQRAVENLTAVGGGVQGRLAAAFLRVFDAFAYRRLGFNCDLEGEVCLASGVADGPDGTFMLVEGGGLPRIEVIGHNRRVDWPELVRRLDAVREGPPPVVQ